jgi:antibiotic biosynthesis monooxygenase (ABM) superfamily enzyme
MTAMTTTAPVTVVIQTRIRDGQEDAFREWQTRISATATEHPGFLDQKVLPPSPPAQADWVILQRFVDSESATNWLRSERRLALLAEEQPMLIGADDVHLVQDGSKGVTPAPVSAVISTRVKPGQEVAFRRWEQRIAAAQARAPGFQGYRFQPPIPGVQEDWLAILRFTSESTLQGWLDSPRRHALLKEAVAFTESLDARIVRTGFEQWFSDDGSKPPAAWKQNMIVLLALYPVVFLFGLYVQTPWLMARAGMPFWLALFVGNAISILILNKLVPLLSRGLAWWLAPTEPGGLRIDASGAGLVIGFYAILMALFAALSR